MDLSAIPTSRTPAGKHSPEKATPQRKRGAWKSLQEARTSRPIRRILSGERLRGPAGLFTPTQAARAGPSRAEPLGCLQHRWRWRNVYSRPLEGLPALALALFRERAEAFPHPSLDKLTPQRSNT